MAHCLSHQPYILQVIPPLGSWGRYVVQSVKILGRIMIPTDIRGFGLELRAEFAVAAGSTPLRMSSLNAHIFPLRMRP